MIGKVYTVGDLIKEFHRAIILGELDENSEILNRDLEPAVIQVAQGHVSPTVVIPGHVVVS